ncbi:MarR family transcriptional regulator [Halobellus sp. Atlit-38R]|uniref:winged helix DNA-binding protein n=1 Tax=Halobellus sp. Atlit-38R TaxID=2282131 RepID=UPI000EF195C8|nr:MarR family transcriptional regulator [Halobellus sp. Atlit-38R]
MTPSLQSICEQTDLAESTTRYALGHLSQADLLVSRPDPADARRRLYALETS